MNGNKRLIYNAEDQNCLLLPNEAALFWLLAGIE